MFAPDQMFTHTQMMHHWPYEGSWACEGIPTQGKPVVCLQAFEPFPSLVGVSFRYLTVNSPTEIGWWSQLNFTSSGLDDGPRIPPFGGLCDLCFWIQNYNPRRSLSSPVRRSCSNWRGNSLPRWRSGTSYRGLGGRWGLQERPFFGSGMGKFMDTYGNSDLKLRFSKIWGENSWI